MPDNLGFIGIQIALNPYDYQSNKTIGHQVARNPGSDIVHFVWMQGCSAPGAQWCDLERSVYWAGYSLFGDSVVPAHGGVMVSLDPYEARAGFANVAVGQGNLAHVSLHQRTDVTMPYAPWHLFFPVSGTGLHVDDPLGGNNTSNCTQALWTKIAVSQNPGGEDIVHEIAIDDINYCEPGLIWYWRFDGSVWQGPVIIDSTEDLGFMIATDNNSPKTCLAFTVQTHPAPDSFFNVAFHESQTDGAGWLNGSELGPASRQVITSYASPVGPQAWPDLGVAYDGQGDLHIVWIEQTSAYEDVRASIKHWGSASGTIRTVANGDWPGLYGASRFNLNLSKVSLGIGDGSTLCSGGAETNEDYLYVVYAQYGGSTPAEEADVSAAGYFNGDVYLGVSLDGGNSWSVPQNLTNTKTPNCSPYSFPDSICRSEAWPSIGLAVSDIDIFYVGDIDAGGIPQGEGTWQLNPMMYLRLPGGTVDAQYLCPSIASRMTLTYGGSPNSCGLVSLDGVARDTMTQTISNSGNGELSGTITITYDLPPIAPAQWLRINDSAQTIPFAIVPGGPDLNLEYVCDPTGVAPGIYTASITITHNDPNLVSPINASAVFTVHPCICHNDPVCDGAVDVLDVVKTIGIAFRGDPVLVDELCPNTDADVDCSGAIDVLDVVHMVNVAFRGLDAATEFCHPCQ